jgi:nucleotide-binding universal stress UspA family protein
MLEIRRILCPTDLSEIAPGAFAYAAALARHHRAELELAHVHEPLLPGPAGPATYPPWAALDPEVRGRLQSALDALAASAADVEVRFGVFEGRVVPEILARARDWPADLVVMGTHGRGGFERWVLGSVTERVLRNATCPVLTVPPAAPPPPAAGPPFRRVVCPVDFSTPSLASARQALELARDGGVAVTLVHVVEWPVDDEHAGRLAGFDVPEYRRYLERDALDRLRRLASEGERAGRVEERIAGGRPWREILRLAEERHADLVVMGVRGRSAVDLALFGSTTHHVVRGATCPVLVVHEKTGGADSTPA